MSLCRMSLMLNDTNKPFILSVIMLSVVYAEGRFFEYHYDNSRGAKAETFSVFAVVTVSMTVNCEYFMAA